MPLCDVIIILLHTYIHIDMYTVIYIIVHIFLEIEALRGTSSSVQLQDEIEMLVCNIELTTRSMSKLPGTLLCGNKVTRPLSDLYCFYRCVCYFLQWLTFYSTFYSDSSKQRTRLRSKITADKTKLSSKIQQYNDDTGGNQDPDMQATCTLSEVMKGNFPWGNNAG